MRGPDVPAPDPAPVQLGASRARVLAALQDAGRPLGVQDVAGLVRLHPNTVRFHLEALVEAGLVTASREDTERAGRPRMVYSASVDGAAVGRRSYRLLAEILTSFLAGTTPDPAGAAVVAGHAWGRYLVQRPAPFQRVEVDQAMAPLIRIMHEIGFEPELRGSGRHRQIRLWHCPFRELAQQHQEVVCSVHLGLIRGALEESDAGLSADRLVPFAEPGVCLTELTVSTGDEPDPGGG